MRDDLLDLFPLADPPLLALSAYVGRNVRAGRLLPNVHAGIVGTGSEDGAEGWVGPRDLPDGCGVPVDSGGVGAHDDDGGVQGDKRLRLVGRNRVEVE